MEKRHDYYVLKLLRVLACILVVREHYWNYFDLPSIFGSVITTGAGPVVIFFVISGFLAYISYERCESNRQYYKKRLLRLVPSYYLILIATYVCNSLIKFIPVKMYGITWVKYATFLNMLIPSSNFNNYNNLLGFWTMGCFPVFYLLVPMLYKGFKSVKSSCFLVLLTTAGGFLFMSILEVVLSRLGFDGVANFASLNPLSTLYLFVFGMASAWAYKTSHEKEIAPFYGLLLFGVLLLGKGGYVLWGITCAVIILKPDIKMPQNIKHHTKANVALRIAGGGISFLDRNSFNIYLLHMLMYHVITNVTNNNGTADMVVCFILTLVFSEILSRITSVIVSKARH